MDTYRFRKQIRRLPGKVIHAIPLPEPEVTAGQGARREIGAMCQKAGYRQVLLVTDETLHHLGYDEAILASLEEAGVKASLFHDIHSEPTIAIIEAGRKQALETKAEAIIALGGGSVMDSCKMIAAGSKMPHLPVKALLLKFLPVPGETLPLIMVPSTAGTGAELTVGAVVTNDQGAKGSTVLIQCDERGARQRVDRTCAETSGGSLRNRCVEPLYRRGGSRCAMLGRRRAYVDGRRKVDSGESAVINK